MDSTSLSDYALIVRCKEDTRDLDAYITLFERYGKFLLKKYQKYRYILNQLSIDYEDFCQDAYFQFINAVNYTKIEKITNPDHWKFITPFYYFIENLCISYFGQINHSVSTFSLDDIQEEISTEITFEDTKTLSAENKIIQKEDAATFTSSLSPRELKVFKELTRSQRSDGNTTTLKAVSENIGYTADYTRTIYRGMKAKYADLINLY